MTTEGPKASGEDPRRALGKRPGPPLPKLQLDEAFLASDPAVNVSPPLSTDGLTPRTSTDEQRPCSPKSPGKERKAFRKPTIARPHKSVRSDPSKGLTENRKLLAHLLDRLETRSKAPDLLGLASSAPARRDQAGSPSRYPSADDRHDRHDEDFEVDVGKDHAQDTFDLIDQTRGLLALAHRQGLDILDSRHHANETPSTPSRSKAKTGRLSAITSPITSRRPPSPHASPTSSSGGTLRSRLCRILQDIVNDDCIHTIRLFRPSQPPNGLQAACVDVATFLYHTQDVETKVTAVSIVIDALSTMPDTMLYRLYVWLERRLEELLQLLAQQRGLESSGRQTGLAATQCETENRDVHTMAALLAKTLAVTCDILATRNLDEHTAQVIDRTIGRIRAAKPDLALDLLETIAFGESTSYKVALRLLQEYWPNTMGHNVVASRIHLGDAKTHTPDHSYIPWRVSSHDPIPDTNKHCLVCEVEIHGFCVRCSMCAEQCHLHCLRTDHEVFTYEMAKQSHIKASSAAVKFSQLSSPSTRRPGAQAGSEPRQMGQHDLRLVNLFTTTLCSSCHDPLWGSSSQAYACISGCQQLFHHECLSTLRSGTTCRPRRQAVDTTSPNPFAISLEQLQASFQRELGWLLLEDAGLRARSFDEVAVLHGALWLQYKMLDHGVTAGCLTVLDSNGQVVPVIETLGLRAALKRYDAALVHLAPTASSAATDFAHAVGTSAPSTTGYLFSRPFLTYCTALLRSPTPQDHDTSLLNPFDAPSSPAVQAGTALEVVSLSAVLAGLANDLGLREINVARHFLAQIQSLGLCQIGSPVNTDDDTLVAFTLPLLMDASPTVELLILAIETMLADLDLSMNEQAFILLTNRAWPTLLCSPYALERLAGAIVGWIMNEVRTTLPAARVRADHQDECLHELIKCYASQHRPLPGVRAAPTSGPGYGGTSSVPLYTSDRARILDMYAKPWLAALQLQDPEAQVKILTGRFTHMIYDQSRLSPDQRPANDDAERHDMALQIADRALERLTTVVQSGIVPGSLHNLVLAWLEDVGDLSKFDHVFRALPRLIHYNHSESNETESIWSAITPMIHQDTLGDAALSAWVRIMAVSGVPIPDHVVSDLVARLDSNTSSLSTYRNVVAAITNNHRPRSAQAFATTCCEVFERLSLRLLGAQLPDPAEEEHATLIDGLVLLLKAYGVDQDDFKGTSLDGLGAAEVNRDAGSSKRHRLTIVDQQFGMSKSAVLSVLTLMGEPRFPTKESMDWLWLVSTKASAISNVDSFLYDIAPQIFDKLWPLLRHVHLRSAVMRVLTRLFSIAGQSLGQAIGRQLQSKRSETRELLHAFLLGLFDSTTSSVVRITPGAVTLVTILFDEVLDPRADAPAMSTFTKSLLPTQLSAISQLFADQLARSDDDTRLTVLGKLARYRQMIPQWPILSWVTIEELLAEQISAVAQMTAWRGSQIGTALTETQLVRASLIALGLDMLASGIDISWAALQRFQQHVASACALPWSLPTDGIVNLILPALRNVLDAAHYQTVGGQNKKTFLIGALFVPVIVDFGNELKRHDHSVQRQLLDILHVTLYKQDTRPVELATLGALQTVADYGASVQGSTENRLLAFRVLATGMSRMDASSLLRVSPPIFSAVAKAMVGEVTERGDSAIVESCRLLLKTMIRLFGRSGMFVQLFKVDSINTQWSQSESPLHKALVIMTSSDDGASQLDTLFGDIADVLKRDPDALQPMLDSLEKFTATNEMELSEDAAESFSLLLSRVTKHIAELERADYRPDSLINICRHLLDRVPPVSIPPLLNQSSTFLLVALLHFDVHYNGIDQLLNVSGQAALRVGIENTSQMVVLEDAVRKGLYESAMTPISMTAVLNCVTETSRRYPALRSAQQAIMDATTACMLLLTRQHPAMSIITDAEVSLPLLESAAALLLQSQRANPGSLGRQLSTLSEQAAQVRCELGARLLLVAQADDDLASLYPVMARSTSLCLRAAGDLLSVTDTSGDGADMLATVYDIVRLVTSSRDHVATEAYWERIWPDWHRLVTLSTEALCVNTPLRTVSHSLFYDLIAFLGSIGSAALVAHAETIIETLAIADKWTKANVRAGSAKLERAKQTLAAAGTLTVTANSASTKLAVKADMVAGEKLKLLRHRR